MIPRISWCICCSSCVSIFGTCLTCCFQHLVAAKLQQQQQKNHAAQHQVQVFSHCHMPVVQHCTPNFLLQNQVNSFMQGFGKSLLILSADPPVFPLQVWPYHFLNLHLWHLHPQKPRLYKCIFEVKNPVCERAYGIHLVVSQAPHVGKSPASRGHVIIFGN